MGDKQSKCETFTEDDRDVHKFEFVIPDFRKLASSAVGYCKTQNIVSLVAEKCWFSLCVYPHGFDQRTENYVSLWLKKESTKELTVGFTCAIVDGSGWELCNKSVKQNLALESVLGWAAFCPRAIILDEDNNVLKEGNLTLVGKVEVYKTNTISNAEIEDNPLQNKSLSEVCDNFHELMANCYFTDFDLKVGSKNLSVHKAILSVRSPVFKRMLESPLQKNVTEVDIKDISYEALGIVVKYVYTGKLDYLSVPIAIEVFYAADKYEMKTLRDICSTMLAKNLLLDNVIDILLLAYRHSDLELERSCLIFISKNLREIKGMHEWIALMKNNPKLADKALFFHERDPPTLREMKKCLNSERKMSMNSGRKKYKHTEESCIGYIFW